MRRIMNFGRRSLLAAGLIATFATTAALPADAAEAAGFVQAKLSQPLSVDDAVRIALLNNPALRALYYRVSLSDSVMPEAILAADKNPAGGASVIERERRLIAASTAPLGRRYGSTPERRNAERLRAEVTAEMLQVAHATRRAYISTVAAAETARYLQQALESAEAGSELARRMVSVGNWPRLNELRERAFHAEVAAQLARARQAAAAEREQLTELLGLWGSEAEYRLPDRLPQLPQTAANLPNVEEMALRQRLDLHSARLTIITDTAEWALDGYDGGELLVYRRREVGLPGSDIFAENGEAAREIRVPVFDREQARRDPKLMRYVQALDLFNERAIAARAQARTAYLGYRTAYDIARNYRDTIIPLRKEISEENLLRYNGMFISVFELLADARDQIASVTAYIEAQRDFWIAEVALRQALTTGGTDARASRAISVPNGAAAAGH